VATLQEAIDTSVRLATQPEMPRRPTLRPVSGGG
ncbi:MAG: hypothetical protein JWO57_4238, partial [Pseudonocardiales bacterium]|nr:hypothetical protein [Pseudonocardiales bacterium]